MTSSELSLVILHKDKLTAHMVSKDSYFLSKTMLLSAVLLFHVCVLVCADACACVVWKPEVTLDALFQESSTLCF